MKKMKKKKVMFDTVFAGFFEAPLFVAYSFSS